MKKYDKMQVNGFNGNKVLFLVRHAKSCWNNELADFERPLKKRGIADANLVSNYLKGSVPKLEMILCSGSERTKLTADIFIKNMDLESVKIKYTKALYDFHGESLLQIVESCDDSFGSIMIFCHNHAITNFVNTYGNVFIDNVPTSGFVKIIFKVNTWKNISRGITEKIVFPKHLK